MTEVRNTVTGPECRQCCPLSSRVFRACFFSRLKLRFRLSRSMSVVLRGPAVSSGGVEQEGHPSLGERIRPNVGVGVQGEGQGRFERRLVPGPCAPIGPQAEGLPGEGTPCVQAPIEAQREGFGPLDSGLPVQQRRLGSCKARAVEAGGGGGAARGEGCHWGRGQAGGRNCSSRRRRRRKGGGGAGGDTNSRVSVVVGAGPCKGCPCLASSIRRFHTQGHPSNVAQTESFIQSCMLGIIHFELHNQRNPDRPIQNLTTSGISPL